MELIDKAEVAAEIERRIFNHNKELQHASDEDFVSSWASDEENQKLALTALIPFLDTLKVKEVDLVKEEEKLNKAIKLADAMYYAAQRLTTDASWLHKAMQDWWKFRNNKL